MAKEDKNSLTQFVRAWWPVLITLISAILFMTVSLRILNYRMAELESSFDRLNYDYIDFKEGLRDEISIMNVKIERIKIILDERLPKKGADR